MKKTELLAPAGNLAKLKCAIEFGADAVYCGVPDFSLRVRINQFTPEDLAAGVSFAHARGKKVYVTLNIYAHNSHIEKIKEHLKYLKTVDIDGVIVSDPGIINLIKKYLPSVDIHLSTQANTTNFEAVKFWRDAGVRRVILAREVTLSEIGEIRKKVKGIDLETFVHGAMCMSYSGRCILSKWMIGRSGNLGDCAQPCRWKYHETRKLKHETTDRSVVDDQKRFQVDLEEDRHGTYFFNSYDMNMIEHVDKLLEAGVSSLKIEGRAKSVYYLAVVVRAYRKVLDALETQHAASPKKIISEQKEELDNLVHRGYSTGFFFGEEPAHNFQNENVKSGHQFVGEVEGKEGGQYIVRAHNSIFAGDRLEAIDPEKNVSLKIKRIFDHNKNKIQEAHGGHEKRYYFEFDKSILENCLLRKKVI